MENVVKVSNINIMILWWLFACFHDFLSTVLFQFWFLYHFTYTGRPRKNFLSEFFSRIAQNAQICPDLPRLAQNSQKGPKCPELPKKNCQELPKMPRLVFWYVLLKKFWKKVFSGTSCIFITEISIFIIKINLNLIL